MNDKRALQQAVTALLHGEVIAYATESVFGLGCDPDNQAAVMRLLAIKQRPVEKGLILIAADWGQLQPYLSPAQLSPVHLQRVFDSWPGPFTWLMPVAESTPAWLTGQYATLAVRVSAHPQVVALCRVFGKPLVSTSANLTGEPPAKTTAEVQDALGSRVGFILPGEVGGARNPSLIRDAQSGAVIRPA